MKKESLKKEHRLIKNYTYNIGGTVLNFSLNVNNKIEMRDFLSLLTTAAKEVEADIKN